MATSTIGRYAGRAARRTDFKPDREFNMRAVSIIENGVQDDVSPLVAAALVAAGLCHYCDDPDCGPFLHHSDALYPARRVTDTDDDIAAAWAEIDRFVAEFNRAALPALHLIRQEIIATTDAHFDADARTLDCDPAYLADSIVATLTHDGIVSVPGGTCPSCLAPDFNGSECGACAYTPDE